MLGVGAKSPVMLHMVWFNCHHAVYVLKGTCCEYWRLVFIDVHVVNFCCYPRCINVVGLGVGSQIYWPRLSLV